MPKKKKKGEGKGGKKGKQKGEKGSEEPNKEKEPFGPPPPTDREISLKTELDDLNYELDTLVKQVDQLRKENDWLQGEAERTRAENQDYQTYVSRRAQKRQSLIVSLSDQNSLELQQIESERTIIMKEFEEKKAVLDGILLEKESELAKVNQQLKELEPYKALQLEQEKEIMQLEKEVEELSFQHENRIRALKTQFLKEKKAYEESATTRVKDMAEQASKQASQCLKEQSHRISSENTRLRAELQQLIEATGDLQAQKCRLERQYVALQQDHQFNMELQQQRGIRWSTSFEMGPELNLLQLQQQQQQRKSSVVTHSKLHRR